MGLYYIALPIKETILLNGVKILVHVLRILFFPGLWSGESRPSTRKTVVEGPFDFGFIVRVFMLFSATASTTYSLLGYNSTGIVGLG